MSVQAGQLIAELLLDPVAFTEAEKEYLLLQRIFEGHPESCLLPLLLSPKYEVQLAAVQVASELGKQAVSLTDGIQHVLRSPNADIRFYALETAAVILESGTEDAMLAIGLLQGLEDEEPRLRARAMYLLTNTPTEVLRYLAEVAKSRSAATLPEHAAGLSLLSSEPDRLRALAMIESGSSLQARYGAVAWSRHQVQRRSPRPKGRVG